MSARSRRSTSKASVSPLGVFTTRRVALVRRPRPMRFRSVPEGRGAAQSSPGVVLPVSQSTPSFSLMVPRHRRKHTRHVSSASSETSGASLGGGGRSSSTDLASNEDVLQVPSRVLSTSTVSSQTSISSSRGSRTNRFRKLFKNIPTDETVINSFACALVSDILLQGQLYVTDNWICFHSNIFGQKTQITINIKSVQQITKEKTAFFIPNAIGIVTETERYVFGSLLSRDSAFKLLEQKWRAAMSIELSATESVGHAEDSHELFESVTETVEEKSEEGDNVSTGSSLSEPRAPGPTSRRPAPGGTAHCTHCGSEYTGRRGSTASTAHLTKCSSCSRRLSARNDRSQLYSVVLENKSLGLLVTVCSSIFRERNPKTLFMASFFLMIVLLCSAAILAYQLLAVQERTLANDQVWSPGMHDELRNKYYMEMFKINNQLHSASVERMHSILNANMELLEEVRKSLEHLQRFASAFVAEAPSSPGAAVPPS